MTDLLRAFRLLPRSLRWRWAWLLPLLFIAAAVEAAGAAAVFALLRILTDFESAMQLPVLSWLSGQVGDNQPRSVILAFALMVAGLYIVRFGLLAGVSYAQDRVVHDSILRLSESALTVYLTGSFGRIAPRSPSVLLHRVLKGAEVTSGMGLASIASLLSEVMVVIGLLLLLAVTAPLVTLLAVAVTAGLLLLPTALAHSLFERWGEERQALESAMIRHLQQGLGALREIRVYGREGFFGRRFSEARVALSNVERRQALSSEMLRSSVETVFVLALLLVIAVVTWQGATAALISLLGLYAYAGFRFVPSANRITMNLANLRGALPFARELCDDVSGFEVTAPASTVDQLPLAFAHDIVFSGVTYCYAPGVSPAVSDVSFRIPRGASVGIVGQSGAGKSTVIDLLLGLLEPTDGRVLVDGQDIRQALRSWQGQIGYVAQSFYLMDDTLRLNIAFGVDPEQIDAQQLAEAVRAAQLEGLVSSLPQGLDTPIGDRGARLSGGERQRVAIARALYSRPKVLVFDEATAALDPQTEREIADAIVSLHGARTIVVIAHRMSTVKSCDRLIMLRDGRVHAAGSFDDLMQGDEQFRALVTADDRQPA